MKSSGDKAHLQTAPRIAEEYPLKCEVGWRMEMYIEIF